MEATAVQLDGAKLKPPLFLYPLHKALEALHMWVIDLIKHMGVGQARRYILVCVWIFSKWVEAFPLAGKHSSTVVKVFHRKIGCRFGTPVAVRCNRGGEFFRRLRRISSVHRHKTMAHLALKSTCKWIG